MEESRNRMKLIVCGLMEQFSGVSFVAETTDSSCLVTERAALDLMK